jgi:hypothetical protein
MGLMILYGTGSVCLIPLPPGVPLCLSVQKVLSFANVLIGALSGLAPRSMPRICRIMMVLMAPIEMGRDRGQAGIIADAQ